ncbi:MAG TPA: tRNA pseudouridine(38-40) synthase TruA [Fontimonas sp.]
MSDTPIARPAGPWLASADANADGETHARYAAGIEYAGSDFSGWQALEGRRTVQEVLEQALSRISAHPVKVVTAGRTDAGVHAVQQVVHFDTPAQRSEHAWLLGTNSLLPDDVAMRWIVPVTERFHARYGAVRRRYRYVLHNYRVRSALLRHRAGWWPQALDADAMHRAAQALVGTHDFSALRGSQCQAPSPVRTIEAIAVRRSGEMLGFDVCGNAFLHHMVRNIVGTLLQVGLGKEQVEWVAEVLASRDRTRAGMTAPAEGLYFVGPEYPAEFALPAPPPLVFPPL